MSKARPDEEAAVSEAPPPSDTRQQNIQSTEESGGGSAVEAVAKLVSSVQSAFQSEGPGPVEKYGYRWFAGYFRNRREKYADYRHTVNQARLDETYDRYLARTVFLAVVMGTVAAGIGMAAGVAIVSSGLLSSIDISIAINTPFSVSYPSWLLTVWAVISTPLAVAGVGLVAGLLTAVPIAAAIYYLPHMRAYERQRDINILLPQAITFMYSLSRGDMTFPAIVRELAKREDTYGAVAEEFSAVVNNMDYFGQDLRTALRETRRNTPSEDLASLLDDMISIIDSGGDISPFLADQVDKLQTEAEDRADQELDTLEMVAEMYVTAGVVGLLLGIVVLVVIASISGSNFLALYALVYLAIPLISMMFIVLIGTISLDDSSTSVDILVRDEQVPTEALRQRLAGERGPVGVDPAAGTFGHPDEPQTADPGSTDSIATDGGGEMLAGDEAALSTMLKRRERRQTIRTLTKPFSKMREKPLYTLLLTAPITVAWLIGITASGLADIGSFIEFYKWNTVLLFVIPLVGILTPMAVFHERNSRYQKAVNEALPSTLKKLAAANKTGMTLQDSIELVATNSEDVLAKELERVNRELDFNVALNPALRRMANRVRNPRLTRVVSLLTQASTASGSVREVLEVAGRDVEKAREIDRQRYQRLVLYVAITMFGAFIFMGVAVQLNIRLIPALAEAAQATSETSSGGSGPFGSTFNPNELKMLLFHGALALSAFSGFVAGKLASGNLLSGAKFAIFQVVVTTVVFLFV